MNTLTAITRIPMAPVRDKLASLDTLLPEEKNPHVPAFGTYLSAYMTALGPEMNPIEFQFATVSAYHNFIQGNSIDVMNFNRLDLERVVNAVCPSEYAQIVNAFSTGPR